MEKNTDATFLGLDDFIFIGKNNWKCEHCGTDNEDVRVVCVNCCAPMPVEKRAGNVCNYCGLPAESFRKSCVQCGASSFSIVFPEVTWWHSGCDLAVESRDSCGIMEIRANWETGNWKIVYLERL